MQNQGEIVARQFVIVSCDAPEVLQPVEGALDDQRGWYRRLSKRNSPILVAAVWNDQRPASRAIRVVVGGVAEHMLRRLCSADHALGDRVVVRFVLIPLDVAHHSGMISPPVPI